MNQKEKLISFLKKYSNEDLLSSFLVMNLFLPNISSPIKIQYLYVIYEEIFKKLNIDNQINSYIDFISFYNELVKYIPSFHMMEDYIPEQDWGEVKYFFNDASYKIFYGADLSNVYDYYSSLELIHNGNDEVYIKNLNRSFSEEFEFSLQIQDYIIQNIQKSKIGKKINPGNINLPSKNFWEEVINFLNTNEIKNCFDKNLLDLYSFNNIEKSITEQEFQENAFNGKNCNYFFIKYNDKYFPVIPRKYCTVIYEIWATNLKYIYSEKLIDEENINFNITKNLGYFVKNRLPEDIFFEYVTPIDKNNIPLSFLFPGLIKSKNKLILLYNLPIFNNKEDISNIFTELTSLIDLLNSSGYKFLLNGTKNAIEFKNKSGTLEILIIIPNLSTSESFSIPIPKKFSGEVFTLDNFLAIIDEIIDIKQLNDFLDFINKSDSYGMGPYISQLDKFGAFIDSKGTLIQGAFDPTSLFLDPHWGTEFRYRSLNNFWTNFPQHNLFGHPRNWKIEKYNEKGVVLLSKEFRGFFFCKDIGKNTFFINSLINEEIEDIEGKISEQMMNILFDELDIYKNQISNLFNLGYDLKLQTIFCSNSFLNRNINKFSYWNHLKISNDDLWRLDKVSNIKDNIFGLRIVFNDVKIIEILSSLNNRNLEIQLLHDVLKSFSDYLGINNIPSDFLDLLEKDKIKKSRHGMFKIFKEASFPEYEQIIIPSESDYKYITKEIAILLKDNNIIPGKYDNTDSKEVVKQIRTLVLKKIDNHIKVFNFNNSIPYIISKNDALHNDYFKNKNRIKGSLDHDKDYNSEEKLYEYYIEYLRNIKNYRFLIEKFIHIKPNYSKVLHEDNLKKLLALVDSFLNLQILSDIVNYGINDAGISIGDDYILDLIYPNNLSVKEKEYGVYIEKLKLGIDGNINDIPEINGNIEDFLQDLDNAFILDFGFGLRNLINVLKVLSLWGDYKNIKDKSYYIATKSEIIGICMKNVEEINKDTIGNIIEFLLLNTSNITTTRGEKGEIEQHGELPIWEYNKRIFRYTLQPLIKLKGKIMWGSYSTDKTSLLWQGITSSYKLPANFNALNIGKVLESRHIEIRKNLELKIQEILSRYTSNIYLNLNPKKLDKELSEDIGDFDIFGYIEEKNIILNIESKIIDNAYCLKDSNRVKEKIYGRVKENGIFQKGYLQKHEIRDVYVKNNYEKIFRYLNFNIPKEKPRIISLFVTITSSWWTVHPILETEVKFLEVRLLNKYLKGLLK